MNSRVTTTYVTQGSYYPHLCKYVVVIRNFRYFISLPLYHHSRRAPIVPTITNKEKANEQRTFHPKDTNQGQESRRVRAVAETRRAWQEEITTLSNTTKGAKSEH